MPPRPRRSPAAGRAGSPPPPAPAPVEDELEPHSASDIDVVEPAADAGEGSGTGEGSRGRAGRSPSGRSKAASGRSSRQISARSQPRKVLSAEELAERRRARNQVFAILGLVILLGAAGYGAWYLLIRKDERSLAAQSYLASARSHQNVIESCLRNHQPDGAQQAYDAALKDLDKPELGYAKDSANETDPQFAGLATWQQAKTLRDELITESKPRIEKSRRDEQVVQNANDLRARFSKLDGLDDAALLLLDKDVGKFMDNPVEPEAGRADDRVAEYAANITEIKVLKPRIAEEQRQRREKVTSEPVRQARFDVEKLIADERFKDALAKVDDAQRQFKDADLAPIRTMVQESAKSSWDAAKKYADTNYATATSPGSDATQKQSALDAARKRMQEVVDRFGIDEYVDLAKAELGKYGQ